MSDKEIRLIQLATIYSLLRRFKAGGKDSYTVEELCRLLDSAAEEIDRE